MFRFIDAGERTSELLIKNPRVDNCEARDNAVFQNDRLSVLETAVTVYIALSALIVWQALYLISEASNHSSIVAVSSAVASE